MILRLTPHRRPLVFFRFPEDSPVVGEGDSQKICWNATLTDETGELKVKVWDAACFSILQLTASRFQQLWEEGVQNQSSRELILKNLNTRLSKAFQTYCTLKVWKKGVKTVQYKAEVHVNNAEVV